MRIQSLFAALLACTLAFTPTQAAMAQAAVVDKQYVLRFGDSLNLKVVENEKLTFENQRIRPDGKISMPLVGEIQAGGLTLPQLTDRVGKLYGKYFVDPHVVINVAEFRPLDVTVLGLVNRPGTYQVKEPVRLLQAIALGGGYDHARADLHNVLVVKANGETRKIDLTAVLDGKVEDNVVITDGDTVRVSEVGGPDWYRILPPLASALSITSTIIILLTRR
jgi:polysaccharide export outer membrane protein